MNTSNILRGVVWPLHLLNYNLSMPLDNETYAGITNPIVALGNAHVQRCDEDALEKGLCITFAEECALSLCSRRYDTSVVNGTTNTTITNEDFGCMSQLHSERPPLAIVSDVVDTHCWQTGESCADLQFTNLTSAGPTGPGFCTDGIVVQNSTDMYFMAPTIIEGVDIQSRLLQRLTGNRTATLTYTSSLREDAISASSFAMEYIAANGLGPVLAGVAASLTQQALLANTSERVVGTVWTTDTYSQLTGLG